MEQKCLECKVEEITHPLNLCKTCYFTPGVARKYRKDKSVADIVKIGGYELEPVEFNLTQTICPSATENVRKPYSIPLRPGTSGRSQEYRRFKHERIVISEEAWKIFLNEIVGEPAKVTPEDVVFNNTPQSLLEACKYGVGKLSASNLFHRFHELDHNEQKVFLTLYDNWIATVL